MPRGSNQKQQNVGPLQAADDMARIFANAVTFGLPDYLEGGDAAARTEAAKARAGGAGDLATAAALLTGGKAIFGGGKAVFGGLRAVAPAIGAKTLAKAAAVPALAVVLNQMRTGSGGDGPEVADQAAAAATGAAVTAAAKQGTVATPFLDAVRELFPGMKELSLNQLGSLSGSFNNMIPASAKAPASAKDIMGMEYLNAAKADLAQKVALARSQPSGGVEEERSAVQEYMQRIATFSGAGLAIPGLNEGN